MDQLKLIFDLIGTPTAKTWEGFNELKLIRTGEVCIDKLKRPKLREKYANKIQPVSGELYMLCILLSIQRFFPVPTQSSLFSYFICQL